MPCLKSDETKYIYGKDPNFELRGSEIAVLHLGRVKPKIIINGWQWDVLWDGFGGLPRAVWRGSLSGTAVA